MSTESIQQTTETRAIRIPLPDGERGCLHGDLRLPSHPIGICVFAHGSGSSRFSPRNQFVAEILNRHQIGTLLMDLLTPEEEAVDNITRAIRFNISLLTDRVVAAIDYLKKSDEYCRYPLMTFGASTGGAAALWASLYCPTTLACAVSRGGRPDLIPKDIQRQITTPSLLVVGGNDEPVLSWNRDVLHRLGTKEKHKKLEVVPGATHLFEESGALERVSEVVATWSRPYLLQTRLNEE